MKHSLSFRLIIFLLLIGVLVIGLTGCELSASKGPQTSPTSEGFPVPGDTQSSTGIDLSTIATQTAQAHPPLVQNTANPAQNTPGSTTYPLATKVPAATQPTKTPIVYVQPTEGPLPETYTLQEGEFPFCIARRFNVNPGELLTINNLTNTSYFYAGEELKIPQTGNTFEGTRMLVDHPTTYTVASGDTLGSIACYFGDISPDMISLQNNLTSTDLEVGQKLIIP